MSVIGSPIDTSLIQAAQAQESATRARDRERAVSERTRRYDDQLDLRVGGMESAEAVRQSPENDSEQGEHDTEARGQRHGDDFDEQHHIDVTA